MPYDWIDPHQGNVPQVNREDADMTDAEKALAEERTRGLRVPGIVPGKIIGEEGAVRGPGPADPRGMVFDHDTGGLRAVSDDDYKGGGIHRGALADKDKDDDKPATTRQQEELERNAPRRTVVDKK